VDLSDVVVGTLRSVKVILLPPKDERAVRYSIGRAVQNQIVVLSYSQKMASYSCSYSGHSPEVQRHPQGIGRANEIDAIA